MRRLAVTAALTAALAAGGPVAWAAFVHSAGATSSFSTDTLAAPSGLSGAAQCGLLQYEVKLTWTATTSTWADGYEVSMATSETGPYDVVPLPIGGDPLATTRTVGLLKASTTYWFRVTATKGGWRSEPVSTGQRTSSLCLL